jgi:hypothetical protein
MATLIDFSVLHTRVTRYQEGLGLDRPSDAFPYVAIETILGLPVNEIENCIVDGSQDRGIDAVYVEEDDDDKNATIHLFQFKYTTKPQKMNHNYPGSEVDKLITIIQDTLSVKESLQHEVNPALWRKIQDVQEVFARCSVPQMAVYFCGNMQELAPHDKERAESSLHVYSNLHIEHYNLDRIVEAIAVKPRKKIDGQIHFIEKQYFERSTGNVKAVIGVISALDLIELLKDEDDPKHIEEAIFEDNIRVYQGTQRNPINQAILQTASDEENNYEFFYLNNGITMTCDKVSYVPGRRHPLVDLENVQIVNGSQTSHALFEAYQSLEDPSILDNVLILVRIYETGRTDIVSRIVQTTNSQTVISSRDLRANDPIQKKVEAELLDKGYFYERKKNLYQDQRRDRRLDALVVGQVLMAFYSGRPHEVKFRRREIFGKYYLDVFDEGVLNADNILAPMTIFDHIEQRKKAFQKQVRQDNYDPRMLFVPHASFYILYGIRAALDERGLEYNAGNAAEFCDLVVGILADMVEEAEAEQGRKYSHNSFFRQRRNAEVLKGKILQQL